MSWQPIETAPKDGTYILAWGSFSEQVAPNLIWVTKWVESSGPKMEDAGNGLYRKVHVSGWGTYPCNLYATHWMPLPTPPEPVVCVFCSHTPCECDEWSNCRGCGQMIPVRWEACDECLDQQKQDEYNRYHVQTLADVGMCEADFL